MLRSFHRVYSSLFTLDGLLERRIIALRVLYLRTSSINLRSDDNKVRHNENKNQNHQNAFPVCVKLFLLKSDTQLKR